MEARTSTEIYERDYLLSCHYGDYQRALELAEKLYDMKYNLLGKKHPDILKLLMDLTHLNYKLGKYEKSLELAEKLYAIRCEIFDVDNSKTKEVLKLLNQIKTKIEENS